MEFKEWLENQGCQVEVTQEEEGNGYVVIEIRIPLWQAEVGSSVMSEPYEVTVNT